MLRDALARTLPDYMVPSAFVLLDALPLLANGKLDRRGLLRATGPNPSRMRRAVAPRTPVERTLATIWREVLNVDAVGAHDNFLDLGGHSLAAARIVSEVGKRFAVELTIQSPFQFATVAEMATLIVERRKEFFTRGDGARPPPA
jgi:acyl carrier protein